MTEAEWLTATDPTPMLEFLQKKTSNRKLRLFNCHCCRQLSGKIREERNIAVLEAAEAYAEGIITSEEMESKGARWFDFDQPFPLAGTWQRALHLTTHVDSEIRSRLIAATAARSSDNQKKEEAKQVGFIKDIFGNPFHPITLSPSWLTSTVLSLAQKMYDTCDFSAMPILADALQDASCDNETILTHCRGPGPHVRGCFVIDLLTGRE
jgi:hypothetical protein